jgi:carbon-monoxide dehydrogenase small subunit
MSLSKRPVRFSVNGRAETVVVEPRRLLTDVLREDLALTGTHAGCEHGVCGTCTVLIEGEPQRSCLIFAVQMEGASIETIEGLADDAEELHPVQQAFWDCHGLQCGFCTPGFIMTIKEFLERNPDPTDEEIRFALAGNICRCTGYVHIVDAVRQAAAVLRGDLKNQRS